MAPNLKSLIVCSSVFVLFLAIAFSFSRTSYYKTLNFKSLMLKSPNPNKSHHPNPISKPSRCVLWMAPFLSGGGYSSEAWSYVLALNEYMKTLETPSFELCIYQHGDLQSVEFWEGLPRDIKNLAIRLHRTECRINETIVVCHSEPGAWNPPLFETLPCPPTGYDDHVFVIGRTMFETDRLNPEHVKRCNRMDSVWVPTEFHVSTFVQSGVDRDKVVKVVQPIDVKFFDPSKYEPLDISAKGNPVLGAKIPNSSTGKEFVFLSVFKWEFRKGWDVMLEAYLKEFSEDDGVALYLLTNPYHSSSDFDNKIVQFVEDSDMEKPVNGWAPVYVIDGHIAQIDLPRLYKAADAFVLPSRGEGWGRPVVEAMAMSLPVITTNWSGPTEYLTAENSYLLPVERMSEVKEGPFKGHLWAEPSVTELRALMRHVISNVEEAKAKGKQAREDMINSFSPGIVAEIITGHIQNIFDRQITR